MLDSSDWQNKIKNKKVNFFQIKMFGPKRKNFEIFFCKNFKNFKIIFSFCQSKKKLKENVILIKRFDFFVIKNKKNVSMLKVFRFLPKTARQTKKPPKNSNLRLLPTG